MPRSLRNAIRYDRTLRIVSRFDIAFEEYRKDPDFRKLLAKSQREEGVQPT